MSKVFCAALLAFSLGSPASAIELGVGSGSSTSGRLMPALSAAVNFDSWAVTGSSTGVRTNVYYLSAYTLGLVKRWEVGRFWWADMTVGFGGGFAYSQYGYRNTTADPHDSKNDLTAGPIFQFRWKFLNPAYLGLDALFGLKYPQGVLALALQDVVVFSIGISL